MTWAQMMQMFEEVFTGGRRLATIGVALLILGLVVSTTGNILSL